ncbi:MAG: hypothetical protein BWK80_30825 [Desulfobacteraceae bacterium IS3]|nr:MAG: hypothetical protein BWK80_30825 [Desulfobacteraceae bacterium IS3]
MKRLFYLNFRFFYVIQHRITRRLTKSGLLVVSLIIASAVIGLDTNQTLAYQSFSFFSCLLVISGIWTCFFRGRFAVSRILPRFGTAGESLVYRLVVENLSLKIQKGLYLFEDMEDPRPSFEEFADTPEPDEDSRNLFDQAVGFYRWQWLIYRKQGQEAKAWAIPAIPLMASSQVNIEIKPSARGYLRFTGITVARPDPLGLMYAFVRIPAPQSLLVLPKRYDLPQIHLPGTRRYHSGGVSLTSSVGDSEEFVSLRDYRPGDSLRKIHWKSWAKTGKPVVKEYQDEFFVRHALVLDTFQQAAYSEVFEEAVSVAASFACSVRTQDSLLDLIFAGPEAYCFTSGRGLFHTDKILEILASVRVCKDRPFDVLSQAVIGRAEILSGCICIFLSWDETRKAFIRELRSLGVPVLVLVITEPRTDVSPETISDIPDNVRLLETGRIREGLALL